MALGTSAFILEKSFAAVKREVTPGTSVPPAATDFNIRLRDISFDPQTEMYLRPFASGRHSWASPVPGKRMCTVKCKADMPLGATSSTPPKYGKLLESCGALETVILTFSGALVTSNSVAGTVNGVSLSATVFTSDSATTLAAIGVKIVAALAGLGSPITAAYVVSGNTIRITRTTPNLSVVLSAFVVTLGAGQATATYSVTYSPQGGIDPTTSSITSMDVAPSTIGFYLTPTTGSSLIVTVKGAMGNCKLMMDDLGQPIYGDFEFKGCLVSIADGAAIALTSPDTSVPPATVGATITNATIEQRIGKFELDFGNDVQGKYSPAEATGYLFFYISKREPRVNMNPQIELVADDGVWTRWIAGTETAFSFATPTSAGLKWTLTAPKLVLLTLKQGDRNGEGIWEQEHQAVESSGNDEWLLSQSA